MLPVKELLPPEVAPPLPSVSLRRLVGEITARAAIAIMLAGEPSPEGERFAAAAGRLLQMLGSLQELAGEQVDFDALAGAAGKEVLVEQYGDRVSENTINMTI